MSARVVVVAVFVLAAAAAGEAFRGEPSRSPVATGEGAAEMSSSGRVRLPSIGASPDHPFRADGRFLNTRVVRGGREHLSPEEVADAFPVDAPGPTDISKVAVAPDGTLVLAVYRFPPGKPALGALQLWRGRALVFAFEVPTGWFGGGLAFDRDGSLIALFSHDGELRGVYDRRGRLQDGLPGSFLQLP